MDIKPIEFDPLKNCRICLQSYKEMAEIFGIRNDYRDILRDYCRVDVELNDGLPTVLCEFCIKEMMQTYNFIEKCQDTDKKLRLAIGMSMKSEITSFAAQELDNEFAIKEETEDHHDSYENDTNDFETDSESKQIDNDINTIKVKLKKSDTYPIKCSHCSIVLKCESIKIIHMRTHTNEKPYQCSQCGKCFRTKGVLKSHMTIHRDKSKDCLLDPSCRFECNFCHKIFPRKSDLIVHTRIHTGETPYSCEHCNRAFTQISSLQRHTKIHTGERPYKCKICNKNFSTADGVRKHQVVHTNERNHNCTMCGLLFKTNTALKSHVEIVHRNSKTVVCEQCGTSFNTPGNLKAHLINIHSEQSGHCYICNKDFKNIEEHNVQHSGQKPFECDSCEKKFSSKHSLTIHIRRHESVNKFPCDYEKCAKSFPLKTMLNHHILKYHRKYMPHTCKRCKRGFYRLSDLTRHIKFNHSCVPNISEDLKKNEMEDKEKKYKALLKVDDSN